MLTSRGWQELSTSSKNPSTNRGHHLISRASVPTHNQELDHNFPQNDSKTQPRKYVQLENMVYLSGYLKGFGTLRRSGVPLLPELQAGAGGGVVGWLGGLFSALVVVD